MNYSGISIITNYSDPNGRVEGTPNLQHSRNNGFRGVGFRVEGLGFRADSIEGISEYLGTTWSGPAFATSCDLT